MPSNPIPNLEKDQHFLIDKNVLKKEIEISEISKKDKIIEIGAGTGVLTKELVKNAGSVLAFEIDEEFKKELEKLEKENKNLKVIFEDALKFDWNNYNKIVSNIPYSLSEPVIQKAIREGINEITLIVGENFKELLVSKESKIGIVADLFFDIEPIMEINKKSFNPPPRVDSWLVKLSRKEEDKINKLLKKIILKNGKIKNAIIYSLVESGKTKNESRDLILKMNLDKNVLEKPVQKITGKFILRLKEGLKNIK